MQMFNVQSKTDRKSVISLLHEPNQKGWWKKLKRKTIEQSRVCKGSPKERVGLCWRILGKVPFEFRVEKSRSDGQWLKVVMMGQMSLDDWVEKSENKNDQD